MQQGPSHAKFMISPRRHGCAGEDRFPALWARPDRIRASAFRQNAEARTQARKLFPVIPASSSVFFAVGKRGAALLSQQVTREAAYWLERSAQFPAEAGRAGPHHRAVRASKPGVGPRRLPDHDLRSLSMRSSAYTQAAR